jgi:TatD DNase family protein
MLIDSHAHLSSDALFDEREALLKRAHEAGVTSVVNICTTPAELRRIDAFPENVVFHAGATTPHDVESEGEEAFPHFEAAARAGRLIAIGETGLDYHYAHSAPDVQRRFFKRYLALALELNLPVIIHCRDAFDDLFAIADDEYGRPMLLHCFTGEARDAERALERGHLISLSGILTFSKSEALRAIAASLPLGSFVIETDSPYLAPVPHRGKQNEPAYLRETASYLANLRNISLEKLASATTEELTTFLRLDKAP